MPESPKPARAPRKPTTPEEFPTTSPFPSGDYSYTLEIVMAMQLSMGKLVEAVDGLKADAREQRDKLGEVAKDVHAAKVAFRVVAGTFAAAAAFLGWLVKLYVDYHKH